MPSSKRSGSSSLFFSLACGCNDAKSVSTSDTSDKSATATTTTTTTAKSSSRRSPSTTTTTTTTGSVASPFVEEEDEEMDFSGLLRELGDLERSVMELGPSTGRGGGEKMQHRRWRSEGGRGVEESVAVVKESEDPLEDFRRSMLQMIVEKEIVDGEGLRHLLRRFLQLNSPRHHGVILRAFAEIWSEVFAGIEEAPDRLCRSKSGDYRRR